MLTVDISGPWRVGLVAACTAALVAACTAFDTPERGPRERLVSFTVEGTVGAVADGDTLTLVTATETRFIVRLSDIDTPELFHRGGPDRACPGRVLSDRPGQSMGHAARESLEALAGGKPARAECYEIDRFGRPVCHVFADGLNLNLVQLERGWGMVAERPEWVRDPASRPAESRARASGAGVWQLGQPTHPAKWREQCWGQGSCSEAGT